MSDDLYVDCIENQYKAMHGTENTDIRRYFSLFCFVLYI